MRGVHTKLLLALLIVAAVGACDGDATPVERSTASTISVSGTVEGDPSVVRAFVYLGSFRSGGSDNVTATLCSFLGDGVIDATRTKARTIAADGAVTDVSHIKMNADGSQLWRISIRDHADAEVVVEIAEDSDGGSCVFNLSGDERALTLVGIVRPGS